MPNKKGGKKFKRGKKDNHFSKKLILKNSEEDVNDQEYGKIEKVSGGGRFRVFCFDGVERMGTVCGQMRKRVWVNANDIVLVCLWTGIQDDKCTIIHKYDTDEAYKLQEMGEFPKEMKLDETTEYDEDTSDIFERDTFLSTDPSSEEEEETIDLSEI
jgi:translation initiation factor 1A